MAEVARSLTARGAEAWASGDIRFCKGRTKGFLQSVLAGQTTGTLRGTVKDRTEAVMPGSQASVKSTSGNVSRATSTDSDGNYAFTAPPVGEYDLSVTAEGFKPYRQTGLVIDINSALVVDVTLELAAQTQSITVTESARVETSDTQLGEVIRSPQVDRRSRFSCVAT